MPSLTVIIPAYNEEENIRQGRLAEVKSWLNTYPDPSELLIINDGSRDATVYLARAIADRVITIPHSGKAAAIMAGIAASSSDIILFSDMDQATPITEASKLIESIGQSADIAIGSRGLLRRGAPWRRYILSLGHVVVRRLILRLAVADTQCGFKACKLDTAKIVLKRLRIYNPNAISGIKGFRVNSGFDTEFLFVALRSGFKIAEVLVQWNYQRTRKMNLFKEAWWGLSDLIRIGWRNHKNEYSMIQ